MAEADVIIKNENEVFVTIQCDESISYELRDYFTLTIPGAQFTPQFRARLWDGKIRLWDVRNRRIYRGLIQHIISFCKSRNYTYKYDDSTTSFSLNEANKFIETIGPKYQPRDYQVEAFVHAVRSKRALLLSPTASGKSLIIYLMLRHFLETEERGLIIVPNISLVEQLYSDFKDYSELNGWNVEDNVHRIYQGQDKDTNKRVTISTWQSLHKLPPKYFKKFGFVIGDEAHQFKAKSLTDIMTSLTNAKYRIGTTGTLDGTKTHKLVLEGLFGSVHKVITTKELMDQKHVADFKIKCLLLKHSDESCKLARNYTYQQEIEYLVLNEERNKFISNLSLSLNGNTLILYQYVDKHGSILYDMINSRAKDRKVFFIHGDVNVNVREETRKIVESETDAIIIASYGTFSTGVNIKNLHNVIFASPSKSRIRNLQSIGRSLRKSDTKTEATLFDIADDLRYRKKENYTLKHFSSRIQIYSEEKFSFKIYKIQLKG
jgi:superfamily II DNA or RNA helicase